MPLTGTGYNVIGWTDATHCKVACASCGSWFDISMPEGGSWACPASGCGDPASMGRGANEPGEILPPKTPAGIGEAH